MLGDQYEGARTAGTSLWQVHPAMCDHLHRRCGIAFLSTNHKAFFDKQFLEIDSSDTGKILPDIFTSFMDH